MTAYSFIQVCFNEEYQVWHKPTDVRTDWQNLPKPLRLSASHSKSLDYPFTLLRLCGEAKIMKITIFFFFKISSSSVFVLTLKFPQISQNSAKSYLVLLQKEQLLVLKDHDFCENKLKYQSISNVRACENAN